MESQVTMTEIARIADVTRQAVTNWRRRPASAPFPSATEVTQGAERFDLREVLDWLDVTGRGRNADARLDAPSVAVPGDLDLENAVVMLALRGGVSQDLAPLTPDQRVALAEELDPDDQYLLSDIRSVAGDDGLAVYVDELLAAAFGPADALDRLYASRAAQGSRGLTPEMVGLLQELADACRTHLGPDNVAIELRLDPRDRRVGAGFREAGGAADRSTLRHLALDGITSVTLAGALVRVVSAVGLSDSEALDLADDVAVDLDVNQVAIVLGPASALCDALPPAGSLHTSRRKTLEGLGAEPLTPALSAAFKLPRGLWREAHRKSLGIWVLQGGTASARVVVADLSARDVDPAELASDVLGALQQTPARAYRYGLSVESTFVWTNTSYAVVVPGVGASEHQPAEAGTSRERLIAASLVTRENIAGFDVPIADGTGLPATAARRLGSLVEGRSPLMRIQSGCRIKGEHLDPTGSLRVLSGDASLAATFIDPFVAAEHYSHAAHTEPGDVVFAASPTPRALVDEEGGSLVAYPSRILRLEPLRAGIGPRALTAAINEMATSSEWKTWSVPNVPRAQVQQLEQALGGVLDHLEALRCHEEAATNIITNLIQGVAEGSVALGSPTTERKAG
ncbi:hypothetical protein NPS01_11790 [Nocardioides psychrotolerans]|uniref:Uncharacterized protein n=1 Tax=Nocardioides psychrotolerans TaxID=1005945 RepID=A0A1I3E4A8_9ACTN|nr:hypothetical protein [Nocardioides psychrotolerans]GEP37516.1 hypothetical protein NPS01_11790 [Nocardioides psychrotolerans]SFH93814.1 hypothetical protein SAMN05216561_103213 [Nocardioides psychrotolerans]